MYEPDVAQRIRTSIEVEIDGIGLSDFLSFVAEVCTDKAEHVRINWQDEGLALEWEKAATRLQRISEEANV